MSGWALLRSSGRRVLAGSAALTLGTALALVPASVAAAHPDSCGTNCVVVPTPAQDQTYGVDNTGATDASLQMMRFLAHISTDRTHTAASPLVVQLQPNSHYWFNYSIQFQYNATTNSNLVWNTQVVPTSVLPSFDLSYTTLDLYGSTIDQCYSATQDPTAYDACITAWNALGVSGKRLHFGQGIIATAGATDVTIDGNSAATDVSQRGKLVNSAFSGDPVTGNPTRWASIKLHLTYSDWQGVRVSGGPLGGIARNINVTHTDIEWVGGDFVQIVAPTAAFQTNPASNYDVQNVSVMYNSMKHSGRQGVTVNGGTTIGIGHNDIHDPGRQVFDSEPTLQQGSRNVTIFNNVTDHGGFGYLNWTAGPLGDNFTFANNVLRGGNPGMLLTSAPGTNRHGVTITGNSQDPADTACYTKKGTASGAFLIVVKNYDGTTVTVQNNTARMKFPSQGVFVGGTNSTSATTTPNNFYNDPLNC